MNSILHNIYDWANYIYSIARGNTKSECTIWGMIALEINRRIDEEIKLIKQHPNKRVVHLALHGYGRTRKKNRNRALNDLRRKEKTT